MSLYGGGWVPRELELPLRRVLRYMQMACTSCKTKDVTMNKVDDWGPRVGYRSAKERKRLDDAAPQCGASQFGR